MFQKHLLARRVLHFGCDQLFWECWECWEFDGAEEYSKGLPPTLESWSVTKFKGLDPTIDGARIRGHYILSCGSASAKHGGYVLWNRIVTMYSKYEMTKPNDKLVALSSLAKRFATMLGDEYIAGL